MESRPEAEYPPNPDVAEVQQQPTPHKTLPVPVELAAPAAVRQMPSKHSGVFAQHLTTDFVSVLGRDIKRRGVVLIADVDWLYSHTGNAGSGVPWYAKVPMPIGHTDAIYAAVATSTGTLSVVAESWAD